jgi:hypothetical protein
MNITKTNYYKELPVEFIYAFISLACLVTLILMYKVLEPFADSVANYLTAGIRCINSRFCTGCP